MESTLGSQMTPPLAAAERNVHHGALPGHPRRQRAHFVEAHVRREADAALARPARHGVLHAIAGEHLQASVIELHRNMHRDFARGGAQNLAHPVIQIEPHGGLVKARGGSHPRVLFVLQGNGNRRCQRGHSSSLRSYYASKAADTISNPPGERRKAPGDSPCAAPSNIPGARVPQSAPPSDPGCGSRAAGSGRSRRPTPPGE